MKKFIFVIVVLLTSLSITGIHMQGAYATGFNNVKVSYSVIHDLTKNTYTYKVLVGNQGPSASQGIQRFIMQGSFGDILYLGGPQPSGWSGYDPTQVDFSASTSSSYIYPVNWDTFYFQGTELDTSPAQVHVKFYDGTNGTQWLTTQTSCGSGDVTESCQVTCIAEGSEGISSIVTCPAQPSSQEPAVNVGSNPNTAITTLNSSPSVTVSTDKSSYIVGDMVKISGTGSPLTNNPVTIQVFDPSNKPVFIYPASPAVLLSLQPSGTYFTQTGVTTPPFEMNGVYTIKATYQGTSAQTTFSVTNVPSAISSTPQSCPGNILSNGQCVIYSGGRCIDKYGNAITGGVTIQNNQCVPATQISNESPSGNQTAQVTIPQGSGEPGSTCASTNSCLQPTTLTVNQGTTVTWLNNDAVDHAITSGKPTDTLTGTIFDSALFASGKTFSFTFDNPGTFDYFDQVHPWIKGQVIVGPSGTIGSATHPIVIPSWIKNNAKWWASGQVSDEEFVKGMQYLISNGMMQIQQNLRLVDNNGKNLGLVDNNGKNLGLTEKAQLGGANTTTESNVTSQSQIPSWVKNNAKWWSEGQVSDEEFIKGMQYLINNGMMHVEQNAGLADNNGKNLGRTSH